MSLFKQYHTLKDHFHSNILPIFQQPSSYLEPKRMHFLPGRKCTILSNTPEHSGKINPKLQNVWSDNNMVFSCYPHTHSPENCKPSLHTDEDNYGA